MAELSESFLGEASSSSTKLYSLSEVLTDSENRRACCSALITLTFGIIGGAVLPIPWAFSRTGIVCGFLIMIIVALVNSYTCDLLVRQSYKTGTNGYESLCFAVGGHCWKIVIEVSLVILLLGTIVGNIQQFREAGVEGLISLWPQMPHWLVHGNGLMLAIITILFFVLPLSLHHKIRQLEYIAGAGTVIVLWLLVVVVVECSANGLPALHNGELAIWGFSDSGYIMQAIAILNFAFYAHPFMMPLLAEMPPGKVGAKLISWSTRTVILGKAFAVYGVVGFFGAAYHGKRTHSNILKNKWLGGGVYQGILNLSMTLYLAISIPLNEFPMRRALNGLISVDRMTTALCNILQTGFILGLATGISLIWPTNSGMVLTVTGATGVCMVAYVIPVINHLILFFNRATCQDYENQSQATIRQSYDIAHSVTKSQVSKNDLPGSVMNEGANPSLYRNKFRHGIYSSLCEFVVEVIFPLLVLTVGICCSIASLYQVL